jgi:cellulose synthase/poly-beta-1,6-N-acetylglucosamine synthase-like glycosyltransferase
VKPTGPLYAIIVGIFWLVLFFLAGSIWFLFFRDLRIGRGSPLFVFTAISMCFVAVIFLRYFTFTWLTYLDVLWRRDPGASSQVHRASLLVPVYNEGVLVESCLRSLAEQEYPALEIVVIDDGSTDDTLLRANEVASDPHLRVPMRVYTKPNGGKATALNLGLRLAEGDVTVTVDGDSMLAPDALAVACAHFDDPTVGAVAGNVKVLNRDNLWGRLQALEYIEGFNLTRRALSHVGLVNIIPGPIGVFRKHVVDEVGGYALDTFAEDADITLRVLRAGWRIVYEPRAIAYTEAPETLGQFTKQRYRWTRGVLQAIRKHADIILHPRGRWPQALVLWYMVMEGILWPFAHLGINLALVTGIVLNGFAGLNYLFFWWAQLLVLDLVAAFHTIIIEEEDWSLILHAIYYRLFFVVVVDLQRVLATFEEFSGFRMRWGKLERIGLPPAEASG